MKDLSPNVLYGFKINILKVRFHSNWMDNQTQKDEETTRKYGPLRWELAMPRILRKAAEHHIINLLAGWPGEVDLSGGNQFGVKKEKSLYGSRKRSSCLYSFRLTQLYLQLRRQPQTYYRHSSNSKNNKTVLKEELRLCRLVKSALECHDAQFKP